MWRKPKPGQAACDPNASPVICGTPCGASWRESAVTVTLGAARLAGRKRAPSTSSANPSCAPNSPSVSRSACAARTKPGGGSGSGSGPACSGRRAAPSSGAAASASGGSAATTAAVAGGSGASRAGGGVGMPAQGRRAAG